MTGRWLASAVLLGFAVACGGDVKDSTGSGGAAGNGASSGSAGSSGQGGSSGNGGSAGSGGANGSGGAGGTCTLSCELERGPNGQPRCECKRESPECTTDIDCAVATNVGTCCPGCAWGYAAKLVEREPCLVPLGKLTPTECAPTGCESVACATIDCAPAARAVCREGRCEGSYECLPTQVMARSQCVNKCQADLDCTLARFTNTCCPGCPDVYPRPLVEAYDCLTPVGSPTPLACRPDPEKCALVDCASPTECPPMTPACMPDGTCG